MGILVLRLCLSCGFSDTYRPSFHHFSTLFSSTTWLISHSYMFPSESLALHGRPAWPALTLLIYFKRTEKVSRIQSHSNWFGFLGLSSNEENAAQSKGEGVDGTFLVNFCIIKMQQLRLLFYTHAGISGREKCKGLQAQKKKETRTLWDLH